MVWVTWCEYYVLIGWFMSHLFTPACGEEELCYIMKLKEGAVPKGAHTNVHQGYNANFLCATEDGKLLTLTT